MALDQGGQADCIDEETALDFVQGRLDELVIGRVDEHVDRCDRCRLVLAEAMRAFRERPTNPEASTRVSFTRLAPGDTLAGRYRVLRFIARGGMGEVYEAEDLILSTRLALKTLAATIADDPHAIRRLKQEVNLARRITHPSVCRIFDLAVHEPAGPGPVQALLFITMELVPGRSLGECLRQEGRLDPARALPIVQAMVAAIGAAHRANIIHRDFKSDNVMLSPGDGGTQRVVVMDFGLARAALAVDTSSIDGPSLAGTLPYMAPEQLEGKTAGPATDIYALGVVLFEMLTGELPFKGEPPLAAAWKRMVEPPPALRSLVSDLDPAWEAIVTACLERDPARRPASVDEVARQLQRLQSAEEPKPPIPVPSSRAVLRPRVVAAGLSAVLAGGVLVLLGQRGGSSSSAPLAPAPGFSAEAHEDHPTQKSPMPGLDSETITTPGPPLPHGPELEARSGPVTRGRLAKKRGRPPTPQPASPPEPAKSDPDPHEPELPVTPGDTPAAPRRSADPNDGFIIP